MAQEIELKYGLENGLQFADLLAGLHRTYPGKWQEISMRTYYYDTPDKALSARQWTLRVRLENNEAVLTLKTPGDGLARGEWEVPEGQIPDDLSRLVDVGAPEELLDMMPLRILCGARFLRHCCLVDIPGGKVELAMDQGILLGGTKELPFWELEAELKEGQPQALTAWCQELQKTWDLQEESRSKFVRASRLAGGIYD